MSTRRLLQTHPPSIEPADSNLVRLVAIKVADSSPRHWEGTLRLTDDRIIPYIAKRDGMQVYVWVAGESYIFGPLTPGGRSRRTNQNANDDIVCPVPGVVIAVHVSSGDGVQAGQDLVIIESMKTEQIVKSPREGIVQRVSVEEGDRVDRGMRLVVLVPLTDE